MSLEKKQNELNKMTGRLTEIENQISGFQAESEAALIAGKDFDFSKLGRLETEKKSLTAVVRKLEKEVEKLSAEDAEKKEKQIIAAQKAASEAHQARIEKKIKDGFNLIISALAEPEPDTSAYTERFSESKYFEFKDGLTGKKLFKENLFNIFPNLKSDPMFNKRELNNFVNQEVK
jgi:hypothetical protein